MRVDLLELTGQAEIDSPFTRGENAGLEPFREAWGLMDDTSEAALLKHATLLFDVAEGQRVERRRALFLPPPARFTLPLRLPGSYHLRFHLGVMAELPPHTRGVDAGMPIGTSAVRWTVSFEPESGAREVLAQRVLDPARTGDHGWHRLEVDLSPWAGRSGRLRFDTSRVIGDTEPTGAGLAFVGSPELLAVTSETTRRPSEEKSFERLNVLLIGVDTLRADHLGAWGYPRPTSPHLDALAGEGVRFERAIAPAPWTLPSFSSLMTSLYPSRHGAGMGGRGSYATLSSEQVLLAEIFDSEGYRTFGLVNNLFLRPSYGLAQGFDVYGYPRVVPGDFVDGRLKIGLADAERLCTFLENHTQGAFFAFWHMIDPHLPYYPREGFTERFADPSYEGVFKARAGWDELVQRPGRRRFAHEGAPPIPPMSDADARRIEDLYDSHVAVVDEAVGRVIRTLRTTGLWERTVIVFVADHGEGLADHGYYHHGYTLYQEELHVPLIFRHPGGPRGQVIAETISTLDVGPMLLASLGMAARPDMQGTDRLDPANRHLPVFSETPTYDSSALKAVYLDNVKYLHDPVFGREEVFRLDEDAGERNDVFAESDEFVQRARHVLDRFRERNLRGGRYHLRIAAPEGVTVTGRLRAGEVFDANVVVLPGVSEGWRFDLERKHLDFTARADRDGVEVIFWMRGEDLGVELSIDGEGVAPEDVRLGDGEPLTDLSVATSRIPVARGRDLSRSGATAWLWLEESGLRPLERTVTSEEKETLRALGYIQ